MHQQKSQNPFLFLAKKTEKIVAAIHMVTALLSDNEPLKWALRDHAVALFSDLYGEVSGNATHAMKNSISEIVSLIDAAHLSGMISEMNMQVLRRELWTLRDLFEEQARTYGPGNNVTLKQDFFQDRTALGGGNGHTLSSSGQDLPPVVNDSIGEGNGEHSVLYGNKEHRREIPSPREWGNGTPVSDTDMPVTERSYNRHGSNGQENNAHKRHKLLTAKDASDKKKKNRRECILKALKKKGNLTIKDIARVVTGCSEKTIQRELIELIKDNQVQKEGERRWSRYSLTPTARVP